MKNLQLFLRKNEFLKRLKIKKTRKNSFVIRSILSFAAQDKANKSKYQPEF